MLSHLRHYAKWALAIVGRREIDLRSSQLCQQVTSLASTSKVVGLSTTQHSLSSPESGYLSSDEDCLVFHQGKLSVLRIYQIFLQYKL